MKKIDYSTYKTPSDYMKFPLGSSVIRIVSSGGSRKVHGMRTKQRWIPLGECKGLDCEHCKEGNQAKLSYVWIILDRAAQELKLLDVGKTLGDEICIMGRDNGDPQNYDIEVKRIGTGKNDTKYSISKLPDKPLTEEEKKIINDNKQYLINKYLK